MIDVHKANPGRRFVLGVVAISTLAWLLREYFVLATVVEMPIRGDIRDYMAYAWNLVHHGVLSRAWPSDVVPAADGFRGPGYPLFLAAAMVLKPQADGWYILALHAQALLGALTVTATILLGRRWLTSGWALLAGLLLALWPHHIAATGALLSEVVFGATLAFAVLLSARALEGGRGWAIAAGAMFACAWLVNPLALFLPPLFAALAWRDARRPPALWMLGIFLLPVLAWTARDLALPEGGGSDRARINLVQGSWPQYHRALALARLRDDPIARQIMAAIDGEERLIASDTAAGLSAMLRRMDDAPAYYAKWYLLQKPWLLWDWEIRIGAGGVYFLQVAHSPLDTNPPLRATARLFRVLNPLLFALAAPMALVLLTGAWRRRAWAPLAAAMTALVFVYVTAMHALLQAEPRYSIPYRPFELLLAASALAAIIGAARGRWPASAARAGTPP